ncbi:hypothetical protein ACJ41O_009129 [Fusarium nematophilum]
MKESCEPVAHSSASSQHASAETFNAPGPDHVVLVKKKNRWFCIEPPRLRNNLHWTVGFLELGNAGDFAANVWNEVPVPIYAVVLMAIGGVTALLLSIFAFRDSKKAWRNIVFLRQQRRLFQEERTRRIADSQQVREVDVLLEIATRELRIEIINRWVMDILMGGGAVLIGIGTFMAIGGANRKVWLASNILSGYLGNAPIALFGLISSIWAVMVWRKMQHHKAAARDEIRGAPALAMLEQRCFNVQLFYAVNGTATILGGVGSMLTAERWWGYVILIPVIMASFFCNVWWRKRVGYDRPNVAKPPPMSTESLVEAVESAGQIRRIFQDGGFTIRQIVGGSNSLGDVLEFFVRHDLFEKLCLVLVQDQHLESMFFHAHAGRVELDVSGILALPEPLHAQVLNMAEGLVKDQGLRHFVQRERFMIEVLGTYLSLGGKEHKITEK